MTEAAIGGRFGPLTGERVERESEEKIGAIKRVINFLDQLLFKGFQGKGKKGEGKSNNSPGTVNKVEHILSEKEHWQGL